MGVQGLAVIRAWNSLLSLAAPPCAAATLVNVPTGKTSTTCHEGKEARQVSCRLCRYSPEQSSHHIELEGHVVNGFRVSQQRVDRDV
jgi:hypothetical protein